MKYGEANQKQARLERMRLREQDRVFKLLKLPVHGDYLSMVSASHFFVLISRQCFFLSGSSFFAIG